MKDKALPILVVIVCLVGGAYGIHLGMGEHSNRLWSSMSMEVHQLWNSLFGPNYIVKDSGVRVGLDDIYWLDNHRVIFIGTDDPPPDTLAQVKAQADKPWQIYIWNTNTNDVHVYKENVSRWGLCYADGRIRYRLSRVKRRRNGVKVRVDTYMAGPLDNPTKHERTYKLPISDAYFRKWDFNKFTCSRVKRPSNVPERQAWMMLNPKHGYLTYGDTEYFYHPTSSQKAITLPFNIHNVWESTVHWYGFHGGYLWYEQATNTKQRTQWRQSDCLRGWWLYPNGNTESICIPSGIWAKYGADFIAAVRKGYVFGVKTRSKDVRGFYVVINDVATRVIGGIVEQPVVSPNGCRVAFAQAPNFKALQLGGKGYRTLKMVNVCKSN